MEGLEGCRLRRCLIQSCVPIRTPDNKAKIERNRAWPTGSRDAVVGRTNGLALVWRTGMLHCGALGGDGGGTRGRASGARNSRCIHILQSFSKCYVLEDTSVSCIYGRTLTTSLYDGRGKNQPMEMMISVMSQGPSYPNKPESLKKERHTIKRRTWHTRVLVHTCADQSLSQTPQQRG